MNEAPRGYWDEVTRAWDGRPSALWRAHSDRVNRALCHRWLAGVVARRLLKTDSFDEGVGEGTYPLLRRCAAQVVSVDVSPATLGRARGRYVDMRVVGADVRALPFADGAFDVVFSPSTLDHFDHLEEVSTCLRELGRVVAPGGRLLLTLDNLANPMIALRNILPLRALQRFGFVPYYVGATCTPRQLRQIVEGAGFRIEELTAIQHAPRFAAVQLSRGFSALSSFGLAIRLAHVLPVFEMLERLPTRFLTGHFTALHAVKR